MALSFMGLRVQVSCPRNEADRYSAPQRLAGCGLKNTQLAMLHKPGRRVGRSACFDRGVAASAIGLKNPIANGTNVISERWKLVLLNHLSEWNSQSKESSGFEMKSHQDYEGIILSTHSKASGFVVSLTRQCDERSLVRNGR